MKLFVNALKVLLRLGGFDLAAKTKNVYERNQGTVSTKGKTL